MNSTAFYNKLINRSDLVAFSLFAAIFIGQTSLFFESQDRTQFLTQLCYRAAAPCSQADILRPDHSVSQAQNRPANLFIRIIDFSFEVIKPINNLSLRIASSISCVPGQADYLVLQVFRI